MFSIEGMVAVVTGGASGIGRAVAERFARAGAKVAIIDIADGREPAERMGADFIRADVAEEDDVARALAEIAQKNAEINILVNNAAIQPFGPTMEEETAEDFKRTFEVNVNGVFYGLKHAPRHMPDGASIINTASISGFTPMPGIGKYGASKAAVIFLTQAAAIELAERRIRVNCVCPGITRTPVVTADPERKEERMAAILTPLGRAAEPDEIAGIYHFLAAPESGYVTGQTYLVDGGLTTGWSKQLVDTLLSAR
ncbi:MAG: SDR family oxidoreductase [Alphaproteobacteria bacterium]|nr:SDR family NAD(P)-dependent oxidoreductase [Pseudomonadota bacterium]